MRTIVNLIYSLVDNNYNNNYCELVARVDFVLPNQLGTIIKDPSSYLKFISWFSCSTRYYLYISYTIFMMYLLSIFYNTIMSDYKLLFTILYCYIIMYPYEKQWKIFIFIINKNDTYIYYNLYLRCSVVDLWIWR